ncbi:MAG: PAS domain S-box protein, partial [Elusimicrobia bacterium]|nr:PAS domain S-box protein [Elusimicrobiota bacterium]
MKQRAPLLLKVIAVIVAAETAVMFTLPALGLASGWGLNVLDALVLAVLVAPLFYFWIFREARQKADWRQAHRDLDVRFRALLDNELVGVYVIKDSRFVYVNKAFAAIFGYAQHELLALNNFLDLVSEADRAKVQEQIRLRQQGGRRASRYTAVCRRFDGSPVLVDIMGSVLETAEGRLLMGMLTDISQQERQRGELLRNLEARQVLDRILRISLEKGALLEVLDRAFTELFSIPWLTIEPKGALFLVEDEPEVLVLKLQRGLSEEHMRSCGRVAFGRCLCGRAARTQECVCADSDDKCHETVLAGSTPHGHYCVPIVSNKQTLGLLNLYIKAEHPADEREKDFLRSVADIFSGLILRKRAEAQQALLFTTIEQAGETVVITDPDSRILYVNPAFTKVTGYSREEAVGKTPRLLKSGAHDDAFFKQLWQTVTAGQVWRGRITNRKKDGSLYLDETAISPVHDASGRIVNFVAVRHDVTAEVEREGQLRQAQKMEAIGLLAGGVAHDVNNMLTLILGYNYLLMEGLKEGSPLRGFAGEIGRAVEVGSSMTRQLLAVSRRQVAR